MSQWQLTTAVLAMLAWWVGPPASLGELAKREAIRRQLTPKSTHTLTNMDAARLPPRALSVIPGPSSAPAATADAAKAEAGKSDAAKPAGDKPAEPPHDEAWWQNRITVARAALERDQLLVEAMQSRINALTTEASARDDPAQRAALIQQRLRAVTELDTLKRQVVRDQQTLTDIAEDARKQGIPPAWIR
jgi:hypothetical protein